MNKVGDFKDNLLQEDLAFLKQLGNNKIKNDIWARFCAVQAHDEDEESESEEEGRNIFKSHPRTIFSDSILSRNSSPRSPRRSGLGLLGNKARPLDLMPDDSCVPGAPPQRADIFSTEVCRKQLKSKLTKIYGEQDEPPVELNQAYADVNRPDQHDEPPPNKPATVNFEKKTQPKGKKKDASSAKNVRINNLVMKSGGSRVSMNSPMRGKKESMPSSHRSDISVGTFNTKIKNVIQKCLTHINDIRGRLETGTESPRGDEDINRRMKRTSEFSARFSRNYVYPLIRQLDSLSNSKPHSSQLNQKLISAFLTCQNGMFAYYSHLPSTVGTSASDKMKNLLTRVVELCNTSLILTEDMSSYDHTEYIEALKHHVQILLEIIEYNFCSNAIIKPQQSKSKLRKNSWSRIGGGAQAKRKCKQNKQENRLSMYHVSASFRKDSAWKKTMDLVTKKKYNIKSRYKNAQYKHRPPAQKYGPSKNFPPHKRSSHCLRDTPVTTPVNEDDITTMVQVQQQNEKQTKEDVTDEKPEHGDKEQHREKDKELTWEETFKGLQEQEVVNHEDGVALRLLQLVEEENRKVRGDRAGNSADANVTAELLQNCLANPTGERKEILNNLIKQLNAASEKKKPPILEVTTSSEGLGVVQGRKKARKEPVVTVTGAKNAKLFCIRDDNSIVDESASESSAEKAAHDEKIIPLKHFSSSETQTDLKGGERISKGTQKSSKANVKISRLPKNKGHKLKLLDGNHAVNVIQYKLDFKNHCKSNHLYDKSSSVQPWVLMGKIADHVLEYALMSVVREMEFDGLLENIYKSEFQY